jgi:hypothetical protein
MLSVTENGNSATRPMQGTATAPAKLVWSSPTSPYDFGPLRVSDVTTYVAFTLTNTGDLATSTLGSVGRTGDTVDFYASSGSTPTLNTCTGTSLGGHSSCFVKVRFDPQSAGAKSQVVSITATTGGTASFTTNGTGVWRLLVNKTGSSSNGAVVSTTPAGGINCDDANTDCEELYTDGTSVTLTATPDSCSQPVAWTGCTSSTATTCTLTMNSTGASGGTKTVTAVFNAKPFTLMVNKTGSATLFNTATAANGSVTSSPAGITCDLANTDCSQTYNCGTSVTLTATPQASTLAPNPQFFAFQAWGGQCVGSNNPSCTFTINANTTVTAKFTPINRAFVSSVAYNGAGKDSVGNGAGAGTGGADSNCAALATAAGLTGTFKAWISDSSTDAKQRFSGTTRGWVRLDGRPVADTITNLTTTRQFFHHITLDETATGQTGDVWTGTNADGTKRLNGTGTTVLACNDWANATASYSGGYGNCYAGAYNWTSSSTATCNAFKRLYCFQDNYNAPVLPTVPPGSRLAFFTTGLYSIAASGSDITTMDALCQTEAAAAGLSGSGWKALVAPNGATAASRFVDGAEWYRVDGIPLFFYSTLTAGNPPGTPLDVTASGSYWPDNRVYTGAADTNTSGTTATTCTNWTSNVGTNATEGRSGFADASWFANYVSQSCVSSAPAHLYCLQP